MNGILTKKSTVSKKIVVYEKKKKKKIVVYVQNTKCTKKKNFSIMDAVNSEIMAYD